MRHRMRGRKLGRTSAHRKALYRNLVTSLLQHERVQTTDAKAKEVRRLAERMITLGKRGDLHARRRALRVIRHRDVAAKVFDDLAERYRDRPGGYTRVLKLGSRVGDAAPISIVELVGQAPAGKPAPATKAAAAKKKAGAAKKKATETQAAADEKPEKKTKRKQAASKKPAGSKKTGSKAATGSKKTTRKKSSRGR
jgi:large subunit ribosomal protein L17